MQAGDAGLNEAILLRYNRCRPDRKAGPCIPQRKGQLSLGGIGYGDFALR